MSAQAGKAASIRIKVIKRQWHRNCENAEFSHNDIHKKLNYEFLGMAENA